MAAKMLSHRLDRTAHRKDTRQKASGKIQSPTGGGMRGVLRHLGLVCACVGMVGAGVAAPAAAQGSYSPYDETASAALARYVRTLASNPKDFDSLIGAGRAALEVGDTQAAAGFFARADDIKPNSPLPQAGMGAVSVSNGDAQGA